MLILLIIITVQRVYDDEYILHIMCNIRGCAQMIEIKIFKIYNWKCALVVRHLVRIHFEIRFNKNGTLFFQPNSFVYMWDLRGIEFSFRHCHIVDVAIHLMNSMIFHLILTFCYTQHCWNRISFQSNILINERARDSLKLRQHFQFC